jgi:hypothetical protein
MHWPAVASAAAAVCGTVWLLLQRNSRDAHAEEVSDVGQVGHVGAQQYGNAMPDVVY